MRARLACPVALAMALLVSGAVAAAPAPEETGRNCSPEPIRPQAGPDPLAQALRHYVRGRLLMGNGEHALAARELRAAAALAPKAARVWRRLGEALYEVGDLRGAVEALDETLRLRPTDVPSLYLRGRAAHRLGRPKDAVASFEALVRSASEHSPYRLLGLYHLARTHQEGGDVDAAIRDYETLLRLLAEPRPFFRQHSEIYLLYRGQAQLKEVLGRLYLLRGDNDRAILTFSEALADRPHHTILLGLLCRACIQKKDFPNARAWARKLIEAHPGASVGYRRLVETYRAEDNLPGAVAELEDYRRRNPENHAVAFQLAEACEAADEEEKAAALYGELAGQADRKPGSVAAALKLAELHRREGRPVEALEALAGAMTGRRSESAILVRAARLIDGLENPEQVYRDAGRLVTDDAEGCGPFVLVGMLAERAGKPDEAIDLYHKAIARQPKTAIAYSRKAHLLIRADRLEDALGVYRAAIAAGLPLPAFHRQMGMILERLDRLDEAVEEYRVARRGAPDDRVTRRLLVAALMRLGKLDEAEAELTSHLLRFPTDVRALCQLAAVHIGKNDLARAEQAIEQALAIDAESVPPRGMLAEIRYRQERFAEAEHIARAILADHPEAEDVRLLLAHALAAQGRHKEAVAEVRGLLAADPENIAWRYLLAGLYNEMEDAASSEKELLRILEVMPDHAPSNNDLAYMWADRGVHVERAERMIRLALKADPQSAAYLDSLGWVFYKRGRFEESLEILESAAEKAPDLDPTIWDHLGDACWRLSREAEAIKAWEKAAQILEARTRRRRPEDLARVRRKVEDSRAGEAPSVAPLADENRPENDESLSNPPPEL